ncbi:alkyl/aryl-sulfatase [Streptomyces sp. NY05-11A]|uniref:alkyl/aryl-sulfatase n=1 Tax=Streptomyces soliscabiei TaxID=588897 RepID=UPI0029A78982|nr:alkyl sulfatase dimerization domain-containing protein [Streptomyces sp. NY05-11A]MDX2680616.1 alkyl sulfatase dimerization domain-containing protein [Streptomyces sp. NY05-11A]
MSQSPDPTAESQPRAAGPVTAVRHAAAVDALPWADRRAFEDVQRGRIAAIEPPVVRDGSGRVVWDLTAYDFIDGDAPTTVHPSLWRLSRLHRNHGLFEVTDGVYQVRGYDAANMAVVVGERGYVVIDPLTCVETSSAALDLVRRRLGDRPVTAVVHTHGHIDHFGGVKGVVDEADVRAGRVPLVAPAGFYEHAISENISAGVAMSRRSGFMFGGRLRKGPRGHVMNGSCAAVATGRTSLIRPTHEVRRTGEEIVLDGVRFVFQYVADAEAPAELTFHLPERRALCMAELISHHMHNLYTLRGAPVRDAAAWSAAIDEALRLYGDDSDVMFLGHGWPLWGQEQITELLGMHRDLYRYVHDETLRLTNHGYTPNEIAELIELPQSLDAYWANRGNYGATRHNVKAVYQHYLGWFDANPAHLDPLPPAQVGRRYVELMGGIDAVVAHARTAHDAGEDRWAAELLAHALAADPQHQPARLLQADVFEQLGYRSEAAPWRNFYLVGAQELRHGTPNAQPRGGTSPDLVAGMTTEMVLDYMAIRLNGPDAAMSPLRVGLDVTGDQLDGTPKDRLLLIVENGVLRHARPPYPAEPAGTLRITHAALADLAYGTATLDGLLTKDAAAVDGDRAELDTLLRLLDKFTGTFELVVPHLR